MGDDSMHAIITAAAVILFFILIYHVLLFMKGGIYPSRYVLKRRLALLGSVFVILFILSFLFVPGKWALWWRGWTRFESWGFCREEMKNTKKGWPSKEGHPVMYQLFKKLTLKGICLLLRLQICSFYDSPNYWVNNGNRDCIDDCCRQHSC